MRITIRLTDEESKKLAEVSQSDQRGDLDGPEMVRLLIHREWNRRHGLGAPQPRDYQAEFRIGRPRKTG